MKKTLFSLFAAACAAFASAQTDAVKAYYAAANGQKGAALKTALCNIIYTHTDLTYKGLWTAYGTTDLRSDGKIWDMYSATTNFTYITDQAGSYSQEGDVYNREHTVPQSWFSEASPMKSDAFHVVPTDGYVNNRRGNYPYGETDNPTYTSNEGFSKLGPANSDLGYSGTVFEPNDEYKGDFARIYFYMATAYENQIGNWSGEIFGQGTYPGIAAWQLKMLQRWAKEDPVSEKETNRNNAVYALQKNRNPFVDYPGLEVYVWGDSVNVSVDLNNYTSPYDTISGGGGSSATDVTIYANTLLSTDLSPFRDSTVTNESGQSIWTGTTKYGAKATAYVSSSATNYAAEAWLISPAIALTGYDNIRLTFDHALNYFADIATAQQEATVWVRPAGGEWSALAPAYPSALSWTYVGSGDLDLSAYAGQTIEVGFRYTSTAAKAGTWEIKNFRVVGDQVTAISTVVAPAAAADALYDLSGRRLLRPGKGVYILNGRKVISR